MDTQLRDLFRATMHSQLLHWTNLASLERMLNDCLGPRDANRLNERLQELVAIMCIEMKSPEAVLDHKRIHDEDIEAVILNAAEQLAIPLPGARVERGRFSSES